MSILIKGMEMPKSGIYRCVVRKWKNEITLDLYGDEELGGTLIELPPHGDLIDKDSLLAEHQDDYIDSFYIEEMPTIIEAEE